MDYSQRPLFFPFLSFSSLSSPPFLFLPSLFLSFSPSSPPFLLPPPPFTPPCPPSEAPPPPSRHDMAQRSMVSFTSEGKAAAHSLMVAIREKDPKVPHAGCFELFEDQVAAKDNVRCTYCKGTISTGGWRSQNLLVHLWCRHWDILPLTNAPLLMAVGKAGRAREKDPGTVAERAASATGGGSGGAKRPRGEAVPFAQVLARFVLADGLPFSIVEGEGFRHVVQHLAPDVEVPSRHSVRARVPMLEKAASASVREFLAAAHAVSFTCDLWTSPVEDRAGFLSVDATWITASTPPEFRSGTVGFRRVPAPHTALVVAYELGEALRSLSVDAAKIGGVTTDRGSNMPGAVVQLLNEFPVLAAGATSAETILEFHRFRHVPCFGHVLNNIWSDLTGKNTPLGQLITATKQVLAPFILSTKRREALARRCAQFGLGRKAIIFPVATRWWSEVHMLDRALVLLPAFLQVREDAALDFPDTFKEGLGAFQVSCALGTVSNVVKVGRVWEHWQTRLSSSSSVTLSWYPTAAAAVKAALFNFPFAPSEAWEAIRSNMGTAVDKRMTVPPIAKLAHMLDPATAATDPGIGADMLLVWAKALAPPTRTPPAAPTGALTWMARLVDDTAALAPEVRPGSDELRIFLSRMAPAAAAAESALDPERRSAWATFWPAIKADCPLLFKVAMRVLSITAESTASERTFSLAGRLAAGRHRLGAETLSACVRVHRALAGELPARPKLQRAPRRSGIAAAADGGAQVLAPTGLAPAAAAVAAAAPGAGGAAPAGAAAGAAAAAAPNDGDWNDLLDADAREQSELQVAGVLVPTDDGSLSAVPPRLDDDAKAAFASALEAALAEYYGESGGGDGAGPGGDPLAELGDFAPAPAGGAGAGGAAAGAGAGGAAAWWTPPTSAYEIDD